MTEPPNSAPQYMLDSRMMAETGCMPKVSGSSSDTPFGAPRPGSTPTRMPSSTPTDHQGDMRQRDRDGEAVQQRFEVFHRCL